MPGSVDTPIVPGSGYDSALADRYINDIESVAAATESKLADGIIETMADVDATCNHIQTVFLGHAGINLDQIEAVCAKIAEKIQRGMQVKMTEVYAYMHQAGIPIPSLTDVNYFAATGDAIGSMGFGPTLVGGTGNDGPIPISQVPVNDGRNPPVNPGTVPVASPLQNPAGIPNPALQPPSVPPVPVAPAPPAPFPQTQPSPQPVQGFIPGQQAPPGVVPIPPAPSPPGVVPIPCPLNPATGMWDNCSFPPEPVTIPSSGTGDTLPGGTCPPGYQPSGTTGSANYNAYSEPITTVPATVSGGPRSVQAGGMPWCYPLVDRGWVGAFQGILTDPNNPSVEWCSPWTVPNTSGGTGIIESMQCVDGCHRNGGGPDLELITPVGWVLYVSTSTGVIIASNSQPDGYVAVPLKRCGSPPQQPPTQVPPSVPPGCVPVPPADKCVPPKAPACGPDLTGTIPPLPISQDDPCGSLLENVAKFANAHQKLTDFLGVKSDTGKMSTFEAGISHALFGQDGPVIPNLINRFVDWAGGLISKAADSTDCDGNALLQVQLLRAAFGLFGGWFGLIPEQFLTKLNQLANTICHNKMPTAEDANKTWLMNGTTDTVWECWMKAAGFHIDEAKAVRDVGRTRVDPKGLFELFRRKAIDEDTRNKLLRGVGVTDDSDRDRLYELTKQFPSFSDLIRFMVRDVFDDAVVDEGKLDQDFELKYTDKAKDYGFAIGVEDELAKYFYRAHWQIPSYTMLREMLYRLRPDKYPAGMAVDIDTMRRALKQDDWAPGFVDRMIEIAYRTITKQEAEALYMNHQIDDETFVGYLKDNQYSDENARIIQGYQYKLRQQQDLLRGGFPTIKQLVRLYSQCMIDEGTFTDAINRLAISEEQAQSSLEAAELSRSVWERKQTITTIQRSFRFGLIDEGQASSQLAEAGIDPGCVPGLVRRMRRNNQSKPKQDTAANLCNYRKYGIIDAATQFEALTRIGYDAAAAGRMVALCTDQLLAAAEKAAEAALKTATTAQNKASKPPKSPAKSGKPVV